MRSNPHGMGISLLMQVGRGEQAEWQRTHFRALIVPKLKAICALAFFVVADLI
jgi:hypothetical protein